MKLHGLEVYESKNLPEDMVYIVDAKTAKRIKDADEEIEKQLKVLKDIYEGGV